LISIYDLRGRECRVTRVDFNDGVDLLIEDEAGDVLHLMLNPSQAEALAKDWDKGWRVRHGAVI
jgi:hypothetical protein